MELPCFAYKIHTKTIEYLAKNTFHTKAKKINIVLSDPMLQISMPWY
jgi:hypothetical protein